MYFTIGSNGTAELSVKHSKFLAFCARVTDEDEAETFVRGIKKRFADATHAPYAYILGDRGDKFRASDDGEPSGTSGIPILESIKNAGLTDTAVVVVRYFGGIKLGIPGLIRAYKTSTADALANASVTEKIAGRWYRIGFSYDNMQQVMKTVKDLDLPQRSREFGADCSMEVRVRRSLEEDFLERTRTICTFVDYL